jgi:hypothetical protein
MNKIFSKNMAITIFAMILNSAASAETIRITSYDVQQTPISGFGGWHHTYNGTITPTGRTDWMTGFEIADYSGGGGTLNDGLIANGIDVFDDHLFLTRNDSAGLPIIPVITLHLDGIHTISQISLFGGDFCNSLPGAIGGATVEIIGTSAPLATSPFGTANCTGQQPNDMLDLSTTPLATIPTNQIILRNFINGGGDQFPITEIEVDGSPAMSPTTKAQCKNGGWMRYGFKNQGQCIQLFLTGK